jgi:ABC-type nickel/cobalt efflux system permease component RcnA
LKISLQATIVIAAIFAVLCFSVAISGFTSLRGITDPVQAADARGFAWFWTFLASVALVLGLAAWWLVRTHKESDDR